MRAGLLARGVWLASGLLEVRPFIRATLLLLLGPLAALTALALIPSPRLPRLLRVGLEPVARPSGS